MSDDGDGDGDGDDGGTEEFAVIEGLPPRTNAARLDLKVTATALRSYKFKVGAAAAIDCAATADYASESTPETPLTLDLSGLGDGDYTLCVLGRFAEGSTMRATRAVFTIDRQGPGSITLDPVDMSGANGLINLSWSAPPAEHPASYVVTLAAAQNGCDAPIATFKTTVPKLILDGGFPGGRYVVCLEAVDDLGNASRAANDGQVILDQSSTVHFAYFKGDVPENRALVHVTRRGAGADAWTQGLIASPDATRRLSGRASLQLDNQGVPTFAYLVLEEANLQPLRMSLTLSKGSGTALRHTSIYAASHPDQTGLQGVLALSGDGEAFLTQVVQATGGSQLLYTQSRDGQSAVSINVDAAADREAFQDSALTFDGKGRLHLAYVKGGKLRHRVRDGESWTEAREVPMPEGCESVSLVTAAGGADGTTYLAFACARPTECVLGVAYAAAAGGDFRTERAATIDAERTCPAFSSSRPALAVDGRGRAHVAFRQRVPGPGQSWDVAYVTNTAGAGTAFAEPTLLHDPSTGGGHPVLALDATDRIHLVYLAGQTVKFAWGETGETLRPEAVTFAGDVGGGVPLELADVAIRGGKGRSRLDFGDWAR